MKLKPADGRAVRDPVKGTLLPAEGADVVVDSFWRKRLRDGDVMEVITTATVGTSTDTTSAASTTASVATRASTESADTTNSTEGSS